MLGGSLGLAIRHRRLAQLVCGYARRPATIKECERVGAMDFATTDLLAAVSDADLVILCTPLAQMRSLVEQMRPALRREPSSPTSGVSRAASSQRSKSW